MKTVLYRLVLSGVLAGVPVCMAHARPAMPTLVIADTALARERIQTAVAVAGAVAEHVDVPAYVAADERRVARIRPVGEGRVVSVEVVPGQSVRQGQPLLTFENFAMRDEAALRAGAEAALQEARARQANARQLYQRGKALGGGALSASEVERRRDGLQAATALVRQREAELHGLLEHLRRYSSDMEQVGNGHSVVVSPLEGVVVRVGVTSGQDINASGPPPVEVDDLSRVWIVSQVDGAAARHIRKGDKQQTWIAPGDKPLQSVVDIVEGSVDLATQHVLVRSLVDNEEGQFRPGMLVQTRIFSGQKQPGVVIPEAAVQILDGTPVVFVRTSPQHYTARPVTLGPSLDGSIVVLKGVAAGETVVTEGSFTLKGQAILAPDTQAVGE